MEDATAYAIKNNETRLSSAFDSMGKARVLRAIAQVESSGGMNNVPRHEASWCPNMKGLNVVRPQSAGVPERIVGRGGANVNDIVMRRFRAWGCMACCSYGPWQLLLHTAMDLGFSGEPSRLNLPGVSVLYVCLLLNKIASSVPDGSMLTIAFVADAYNSGSGRDQNIPHEYIAKVAKAYAEAEA